MKSILQVAKKIISYVLSLCIVIVLLKYTYREVSIKELLNKTQQLNFVWVGISILLGLASHLIRAYRWNLLLAPLGFKVSVFKSFAALMVGYMSNLFIPRLGEIVRCSLLGRSTGIPTGVLFGTVGMERVIDLAGFLMVAALTLVVSSAEIKSTLKTIPFLATNTKFIFWLFASLIVLVCVVAFIAYRARNHLFKNRLLARAKIFMLGVKEGFYTLSNSQEKKIIVYTTIIKWGLYYLSDYVGIFAIPATSHLKWTAGLAVLTMSSLSFAVPIQGAIGAYHILVSGALVGYGIPPSDALLYATVIHAAHLLIVIIGGMIGIIYQNIWINRLKR
jgi:uncharacterized protein (TIRG00374 family)